MRGLKNTLQFEKLFIRTWKLIFKLLKLFYDHVNGAYWDLGRNSLKNYQLPTVLKIMM